MTDFLTNVLNIPGDIAAYGMITVQLLMIFATLSFMAWGVYRVITCGVKSFLRKTKITECLGISCNCL